MARLRRGGPPGCGSSTPTTRSASPTCPSRCRSSSPRCASCVLLLPACCDAQAQGAGHAVGRHDVRLRQGPPHPNLLVLDVAAVCAQRQLVKQQHCAGPPYLGFTRLFPPFHCAAGPEVAPHPQALCVRPGPVLHHEEREPPVLSCFEPVRGAAHLAPFSSHAGQRFAAVCMPTCRLLLSSSLSRQPPLPSLPPSRLPSCAVQQLPIPLHGLPPAAVQGAAHHRL